MVAISTSAPAARPLKGASLTPRSNTPDDFTRFFDEAAKAGSVIRWAGDWEQLGQETAAPAVIAEISRQKGFIASFDTGVYSVSDRRLFRSLTLEQHQAYVRSAATFAEKHKPAYLALGVEVDIFAEALPEDFAKFAVLFADTYDAMKVVSPKTQVYTVFQLEHLRGLRGGLFGGTNDESQAQWDLIDLFPKADLVGFTTYPGLVFGNPAEIPDGYYQELIRRTKKPIAFVEVGWPHTQDIPGWESSEAEQSAFASRFFRLINGLDTELAIWAFVYDQPSALAFEQQGLYRPDGSPRPALDAWANG